MLQYLQKINRLFRISDWYYLLGIVAFAHLNLISETNINNIISNITYAILYFAGGYMMNNYFDTDEDTDNKNFFKKNFKKNTQLAIIAAPVTLFFILSIQYKLFWPAAALFVVNYFYSVAKVRLKNNVFYGISANVLFFTYIYYASCKIISANIQINDMVYLWLVACMFINLQYLHHLEHLETSGESPSVQKNTIFALSLLPLNLYAAISDFEGPYEQILLGLYTLAAILAVIFCSPYSRARICVRYLALIMGALFFAIRLYPEISHRF